MRQSRTERLTGSAASSVKYVSKRHLLMPAVRGVGALVIVHCHDLRTKFRTVVSCIPFDWHQVGTENVKIRVGFLSRLAVKREVW